MAACCRSGPCEQVFKPRMARRSLEQYRKKGHGNLERRMTTAASEGGLAGVRVLEIGGGIGTIQAELLEVGAEQGEIVELVPAWEPYARELAREKGLEDRTSFRIADVLDGSEAVAPADVVVMNRVVCCTPDGVELAGAAARLARRTLVLSYPRDVFWVRAGLRAVNGVLRLGRRSFRVFGHPPAALLGRVQAEGLALVGSGRHGPWEFAALRRT
jgi:2-polyprenyl-3-methyl-5-hydroxy-6-metoxy-1,4-benzoquinol methylase